MIEDLLNAFQNFRLNKTRTFLSLLGIVIGVTSVVLITALGASAQKVIFNNLGNLNMDIIYAGVQNPKEFKFDEKTKEAMLEKIPAIKRIFYTNFLPGNYSVQRTNVPIQENLQQIMGVEAGWFEAMRMTLEYGSFFSPADFYYGNQKIIISSSFAESVFPEGHAVGKQMYVRSQSENGGSFLFTVIGIVKNKRGIMGSNRYHAYIPRQTVLKKRTPNLSADFAEIQVYNADAAPIVLREIEDFAFEKTKKKNTLWMYEIKSEMKQVSGILTIVQIVLGVIAGISLLVGGIGIMNIMLVTVTERKKEIGIRKAIGASPAAIRNQFLVESIVLTITGGLFGILFGLGLAAIAVRLFPADAKMTFSINTTGIIVAFLFSVSVGIFFGLHPAIRAARLDPVKALTD